MMFVNDNLLYNNVLENKIEYVYIEISRLLYEHKCTYNEIDRIFDILRDIYKTERECKEYETYEHFKNKIKTYHCDNDIPHPMKHILSSV